MVNQLPDVGRIQGGDLQPGPSPEKSVVHIEYAAVDGSHHEVRMGFLDAMYLLNILKATQQDSGFQMPDDPRSSS